MGAIYLIRHGQASFGAGDYDKLSKRGVEQGTVLGRALAARGVTPDRVVCGGMLRHRETAQACLDAMKLAANWQEDPAWNEYDHENMVEAYRPRFRNKAVMAAELAASLNPRRAFQDVFAEAMKRWIGGEHDADYPESWVAFCARCEDAALRLQTALGRSKTALVFTSGGPISAVARHLLGLSSERAIRLNWTLANAAVTKLIYSERGIYLSTLNEHAHFEHDSSLITYR
ncbi:histidine phosphatase family protein [Solimonas terrae]|uniref:Histidine phosphatase family protein n=1 Tax=Solimonas terrae TaxID=1396819 RepID=A0A6M2BX80_9GAMM|nr:histidine phosphatase family protein [Solimonas terrae]NGY06940.1 histidine phosphatase family protein [Solimonas terrae]